MVSKEVNNMMNKEYNSVYIRKVVAMLKKHEKEMEHMSLTKYGGVSSGK